MNTAPGIIPCSYSSSSRTSRKVASPSRSSAVAGSISRIFDFVCASSSRKVAIGPFPFGSLVVVGTALRKRNATPEVGYSQPESSGSSDELDDGGEHLPQGVAADGAGPVVERRLLGVEDDEAGTVLERDLREAGRRVDGEARARGDEHVGVGGRGLGPHQVGRHEVLAEGDRRRLQDPAAEEAL